MAAAWDSRLVGAEGRHRGPVMGTRAAPERLQSRNYHHLSMVYLA